MDVTKIPDARTALFVGAATVVVVAVGTLRPDTPFVNGSAPVLTWGSLVLAAAMIAADSDYATLGVGLLTVAAVTGFLAEASAVEALTRVAGTVFVAGTLVGAAGLRGR